MIQWVFVVILITVNPIVAKESPQYPSWAVCDEARTQFTLHMTPGVGDTLIVTDCVSKRKA